MPTAANAAYYAEIVRGEGGAAPAGRGGHPDRPARLRGAEGADVDEIVDRAQAEIYDVTERRTTEDYVVLEELLQPTMDEIDAIASRGGSSLGVPTGFADLDELTNGLHPGQMIIVAARPGVGKALALDTPLPTPTGWTTMGEVAVGDELIGADGRPTTVVAATEVMLDRPCYEVEFSDGSVIVADAEHQWLTDDAGARRRPDSPTGPRASGDGPDHGEIADGPARSTTRSANAAPLELPEADLPLAAVHARRAGWARRRVRGGPGGRGARRGRGRATWCDDDRDGRACDPGGATCGLERAAARAAGRAAGHRRHRDGRRRPCGSRRRADRTGRGRARSWW